MSLIRKLHHVAYRCRDAKRTVDFYTSALGLKFTMAMSEDRVPTTGAHCPYMHVFFQMGDGSHVAFFELPEERPMQLDPNTPPWVQHLALEVEDATALDAAVDRLRGHGVEVIGPVDHQIFKSVYFHDPDGHRIEFTYRTETPAALKSLAATAEPMLEEWTETRRPSSLAAWVHKDLHEDQAEGSS
jgi:catechol 2,3-dioxygenase-like lactoylglutathione lyase family enzyme